MRPARPLALAALAASAACLSSPGLLDVPDGGGLGLTPAERSVAPRAPITFVATGGSGEGYRYSLAANASGGTIDPGTGAYVAGARGSVTDVVAVEDSKGAVAHATVAVGPGVTISPPGIGMAPGSTVTFTAAGGSGTGWNWTVTMNLTGGYVDADTGRYTAGFVQGAYDLLRAMDSLGNVATARIDVGDVLVSPATVTLVTGATQKFWAGVTSEPNLDVTWDVVEGDPAGGHITTTTPAIFPWEPNCIYLAPGMPGTYHLRATSVGNPTKSARSEITVVPAP